MKRLIIYILLAGMMPNAFAQDLQKIFSDYLKTYARADARLNPTSTLESCSVNDDNKSIRLTCGGGFGEQFFTEEAVNQIYRNFKELLPKKYKNYKLTIVTDRHAIEELIPNEKCKVLDLCCGTFTNGLFIAKKNPKNLVVGLDRSEPMLREGRRKIDKAGISNVELMCLDATKTGIEEESFDYAIIGLVLHECNPELWKSILAETRRILKPNGRIIILEWERPDNLKQRIKFAPLYITEVLCNPGYFKEFYQADKTDFFKGYGFETEQRIGCNYTTVLSLKKREL